ncbi:TonB-dependent receptor [Roseateles saccharophilus]|uniref:TonB-dependent receptor n=1 Tax=Roseateles saccharophilus TaxID=304 RepID=A0A4R3UYH2_ROSSA|nr:TonB-dependent receptor [Roseateles saccharophilus]MDG0833044.1 TonB-dependent receptor [Roseateles saccharophilus]TCU96242.1 TonB-dependent receptor [Roseateles saccharophilus]
MNHPRRTAISIAAAQAALLCSSLALAQTAPAPDAPASAPEAKAQKIETVVVSGRRAALQSAQKIKQDSDEIVDSVNADDIGKLPDHSVTEVLQRIFGVTIDRTMAKGDPEHYSVEGSGVNIRGLSYVRSEVNGRDTFSANGGRALNFEDVPPELMAGVDVYKNPSASQVEGAVGGLVNLRTALPFDYAGFKGALTVGGNYNQLQGKSSPAVSGLLSNRWKTDAGEFGALLSLAHNKTTTRTDLWQVEPYYNIDGTHWVPKGAQWRDSNFDRNRDGIYGALQWKKDDVSSSLTYFQSKYRMHWDENALFAQSTPFNLQVSPGATYGANSQLLKGTLTDTADSGIAFGADTRYMTRDSKTRDLGWNLKWRANDRWSFSTDVQLVKSTTSALDSTVATGLIMPKETLDLSGSIPRVTFDASDLAALQDKSNYFWAFTMEHQDQSKADSKVWRADGKFNFDSAVLQDLQFGIRMTDANATTVNSSPSYHWSPITQPWASWLYGGNLARLSDPRFNAGVTQHQFKNFFGGQNVPSIYVPSVSLAQGFPASYATLHSYPEALCAAANGANAWQCTQTWAGEAWTPATFGSDPEGTNAQHEKTQAAYGQLRFGWEDQPMPVDGNVGLRVVRTDMKANGYMVFTNNAPTLKAGETLGGVAIPGVAAFSKAIDAGQVYTDVLPSLNLRLKASDQLQFRLAAAQAMSRPDFSQLQAYTSLSLDTQKHTVGNTIVIDSVSLSGTADGNPMLKPVKSNQLDLTGEWYFAKTGSLTLALFDKELKDIIVNQSSTVALKDGNGTPVNFTVTSPVNGAKGHARGFEIAFQRYFDMFPGWMSGFGVQANYTYVNSATTPYNPVKSAYCAGTSTGADNLNLNINGCDTDGHTFGNLPLVNLSKNSYNFALLYDYAQFSARLAYSWRSKYLQAVSANGTHNGDGRLPDGTQVAYALPTWSDAYGQLDAGVTYRVNDHFSLSLEGQNLNNALARQLMQQQIGFMTRGVNYTGRRYTVQASYSF